MCVVFSVADYPYASSYLLHGESLLPAWPVRVACRHLASVDAAKDSDATLFAAVRAAAATLHNNTGRATCFNISGQALDTARRKPRRFMTSSPPLAASRLAARLTPERVIVESAGGRSSSSSSSSSSSATITDSGGGDGGGRSSCYGDWDFQWCTEMTQPFTQGTPKDMFYCPPSQNCSAWSVAAASPGCYRAWGVTPRPEWARVALGGKRIEAATNIVFSNGLQDPWHPGGVLRNLSASTLAILIPNGAHHIDLMFSDPEDRHYPDIGWAREFERTQMAKWVKEHRAAKGL